MVFKDFHTAWHIGSVKILNRLVLAPMAGVNCPAFRETCQWAGAGLTYTQMLDADSVVEDPKIVDAHLKGPEKFLSVQLVGSKPENLAAACEIVQDRCSVVDVNLGCAEGSVLGKKAGAYFTKHPELLNRLFGPIVERSRVPVTAKIRIGWDNQNINAVQVARHLEDIGVAAIAVHGRVRKQRYRGRANWAVIGHVHQNVNIPVIGNGDIGSRKDGLARKNMCDAVMVGRAAMGRPEVFAEMLNKNISKIESFTYFFGRYMKQERKSLGEFVTHAGWFAKGLRNAKTVREKLLQARTIDDAYDIFCQSAQK